MSRRKPVSLIARNAPDDADGETALIAIVENQLRDGTPPAVRDTLKRLMDAGEIRDTALRYIACAMSVELFEILERKGSYDEARYLAHLRALPALPYDEDAL